MMRNFLIVVIGVMLSLPVIAVAQPAADVIDTVKEPAVTAAQEDVFTYSPQGRRDPFEPLVTKNAVVAEVVKKVRPERPKGPLERYELKQYRLLAIMVVKGTPHAMVKAPDGKSYTVKVSDYIGINDGVVKSIETKVIDIDANGMRMEVSPDRIVVEEVGMDSVTGKDVTSYRYIVM